MLSQNEDMDHFETEPRAKRACYNVNEKRLNERHRRQKLIAGLETNQRSRQKRKRKETSQACLFFCSKIFYTCRAMFERPRFRSEMLL